jgi:hypothetical protein
MATVNILFDLPFFKTSLFKIDPNANERAVYLAVKRVLAGPGVDCQFYRYLFLCDFPGVCFFVAGYLESLATTTTAGFDQIKRHKAWNDEMKKFWQTTDAFSAMTQMIKSHCAKRAETGLDKTNTITCYAKFVSLDIKVGIEVEGGTDCTETALTTAFVTAIAQVWSQIHHKAAEDIEGGEEAVTEHLHLLNNGKRNIQRRVRGLLSKSGSDKGDICRGCELSVVASFRDGAKTTFPDKRPSTHEVNNTNMHEPHTSKTSIMHERTLTHTQKGMSPQVRLG